MPRSAGDCDALAVTTTGEFLAMAGLNNTIRIFAVAGGKETFSASTQMAPLAGLTKYRRTRWRPPTKSDGFRCGTASSDPSGRTTIGASRSGESGRLMLRCGLSEICNQGLADSKALDNDQWLMVENDQCPMVDVR